MVSQIGGVLVNQASAHKESDTLEELLQYAGNPLEKKRIEFKARAIQTHLDVHDWSRYI